MGFPAVGSSDFGGIRGCRDVVEGNEMDELSVLDELAHEKRRTNLFIHDCLASHDHLHHHGLHFQGRGRAILFFFSGVVIIPITLYFTLFLFSGSREVVTLARVACCGR